MGRGSGGDKAVTTLSRIVVFFNRDVFCLFVCYY